MEIQGKIIMDLPLQEGVSKAGNPWKKKEWVLETFGQYPRKVKFHIFGEERIARNPLQVGQDYTVSIDLESREFNGRWYTDVSAYATQPFDASQQQFGAQQGFGQQPQQFPPQQGFGQQGFGQQPQQNFQQAAPAFGAQSGEPAPAFGASGNQSDDLPF